MTEPAAPATALPEVACPRCGTTIRARMADHPPRPGERLALIEPPIGTRLAIERCVIERHPDGWWTWGAAGVNRLDWSAVQQVATSAANPGMTVLRWGAA